MGLADIENLLRESTGLNTASLGTAAVARAVADRLTACQLETPDAYWERLRGSPAELQELIEAVVVPETWFFRGRDSFAALARLAREARLHSPADRVLRFLSLPCSTGEEPYSIAMALLDASIPAESFRVDGVDISERALALAAHGVYGRNSFRGMDLAFRDRHFTASTTGYRLNDDVRRQVRFQAGNLFAADLLPGTDLYDVIFCRNVLIYFDRATQDRAVLVLKRLLTANGALFVAPAETGLLASHGLVSARLSRAFAFRRTAGAKPVPNQIPPRSSVVPRFAAPTPAAVRAARRRPSRAVAATPLAEAADDLNQAARLADQGHFAEAAARCETHLRSQGPSARAFYLMGLVRDATAQHDEAAAYYRKAIYLEPRHAEALHHLALLLEKQGDVSGAQVLRNRERRLEQQGRAPHE